MKHALLSTGAALILALPTITTAASGEGNQGGGGKGAVEAEGVPRIAHDQALARLVATQVRFPFSASNA